MNQEIAVVLPAHHVLLRGVYAFVAVAALLLSSSQVAANQSETMHIDISGVEHIDEAGSPNNVVIQVPVPSGAVVQGIGWAGTLSTNGESWADDAEIALSDGGGPALVFKPAAGQYGPTPPGGSFVSSNGIIQLGSLGKPGLPITGGVIYVEFSDSVIDDPGEVEAFWGNGSTLSIQYDIVLIGNCQGDLTGDQVVDVADMLMVLAQWGACGQGPCVGDLNGDGAVDVSDLLGVLVHWGACPPGGELIGACCFGDGSCEMLTEDDCSGKQGAYQGDYTKCETWSCPQPPDGATCDAALAIEIDGPGLTGDITGTSAPDWLPLCGEAGSPSPDSGIRWFTVQGDGTMLIARTCGSAIETRIAVYCAQDCFPDSFSCVAGSQFGDCDNPFNATVSWCSAADTTYLIAVWGPVNTYGEVSLAVESEGACSNPQYCDLPCDGYCGSMAPVGCFCDVALCQIFGDCCPGICESCPDQPGCGGLCPPAACPPGATQESEACGANVNGGCNSNSGNPPREGISCGQTVCGTVWADNGLRDTDWYKLDLSGQSQSTQISFTVQSDTPLIVSIAEDGCPPVVIAQQDGCDVTVSACLQPGIYSLVIAPDTLHGLPCAQGGAAYTATVTCMGSCAGQCDGWCGMEAPQGCWCDDECYLWNDCCPDVCTSCPGTDGC